ncbi:unnamed protein product, partial [Ascophyllum nodosum]
LAYRLRDDDYAQPGYVQPWHCSSQAGSRRVPPVAGCCWSSTAGWRWTHRSPLDLAQDVPRPSVGTAASWHSVQPHD